MPLPSSQISQLVSGQMSMFSNQASYAHQIGVSHGVLPPGVGGQGQSFGRQGYGGQTVGPMGMISNNSVGGMGASGMGAMGGAMSGVGQAVDAFGLGTGLASMAGVGGAAMGAASMAALPIGLGLAHVGGNVQQGAQNISQVGGMAQAYMGPQFGNQGARPGGQMGRGQIKQITSILHEIAGEETMASMADIKGLMDKAGQMGMLAGIGDAEQFRAKFRKMVSGVKDLAKVMGSTFEEAAPLFGQMRQMGVWKPEDIMGTATAMKVAGAQGAPALMQTMAAGAQGSFARGGLMGAGAATGRAQFGMVQEAVRSGMISQEGIMELTGGVGGTQGNAMVAAQLTSTMQNLSRTPAGRLAMAGLGETKGGRFTGRLDEKLMQQFSSGSVSLNELQRRGMKATSNRTGAASFTAKQDVLGQNLAAEGGMDMTSNLVQAALDKAGFGEANEDIQQIMVQKMFGLGSKQAQLLQKMMKNLPAIQEKRAERTKAAIEDSFRKADEKMNRSWSGFTGAVGDAFEDQFSRPIQEAAEEMTTRANEAVDRVTDKIWGRTRNIKSTRAERLRMIRGGGLGSAKQDLSKLTGGGSLDMTLEEQLQTSTAEGVRRGGLGSLLGMGGGERGDIVKFLGAETRREDPGALARIGAAFMGEDFSTDQDVELGTRDIQGRITMASREQVKHSLMTAQRRSRSDFTGKKAFGDSLEAQKHMNTLKNAYSSLVRSPEGQNKINAWREQGKSETEIARRVEGMLRGKGPAMDAMLELHKMRGGKGTLSETALDVVTIAAKDAGDPSAGIRRDKMGAEVGVMDTSNMVRGSAAREDFVTQAMSEAFKVSKTQLVPHMKGGGVRPVTTTTRFSSVSETEMEAVLTGDLAGDLQSYLETGEFSPRLAEIRDAGGDSPINRMINEMDQKPELKAGVALGAKKMGALKRGDVARDVEKKRTALATKELQGLGRLEGLGAKAMGGMQDILKLVQAGETEAAQRTAQVLSGTLSEKQRKALLAGGGAFGGQVVAMGRHAEMDLEGQTEAGFRKRLRGVEQGTGFNIMASLSAAEQKEIMAMFEEGTGGEQGGRALSKSEARRAKQLTGGLTGVELAQEQRSAREEQSDKLMQKLKEYTDANTEFVRAVDVALGNKLEEASTKLTKKGDEVSAVSN